MPGEAFEYNGGCTEVRSSVLSPFSTNVYVVDDGAGGAIVCDPADNADAIMEMVGDRTVSAIFVTHRHHDHIGALAELRERTGAPVYASSVDAPGIEDPHTEFGMDSRGCSVDVLLEDGESVEVGSTTWHVMATPGHTKGSCCFFLEPAKAPRSDGTPILLSGDTLFHGTIGRTDLEGGDMDDMRASLRKLGTLPDETVVFPGHNEPTTIKLERWRVIDFLGGGGQVI
ncbi:MAG: MBL fold metallo-hydrolase [Eggerthellaceae bacterium]|nr:MBL fold metallo-hydrolase [Eggerthellaceae bacterium]